MMCNLILGLLSAFLIENKKSTKFRYKRKKNKKSLKKKKEED